MADWVIYMLRCADGTFYIGISNNLVKRLKVHNDGLGAKYTRGRRPVQLVWQEQLESESLARKRELEMKKWSRQEKMRLVT